MNTEAAGPAGGAAGAASAGGRWVCSSPCCRCIWAHPAYLHTPCHRQHASLHSTFTYTCRYNPPFPHHTHTHTRVCSLQPVPNVFTRCTRLMVCAPRPCLPPALPPRTVLHQNFPPASPPSLLSLPLKVPHLAVLYTQLAVQAAALNAQQHTQVGARPVWI